MNSTRALDRSFWPALLLLIGVMAVFEFLPIDLWLQDRFYHPQSGGWLVDSKEPILRMLFYTAPKRLLLGFGILLVVVCFGPAKIRSRFRWIERTRSQWLIVLATLAFAPLLVSMSKSVTHVFCPFELVRYGGTQAYQPICEPYAKTDLPAQFGRGFPAGHASGGFALLSLAGIGATRRSRLAGLSIGFTAGTLMGVYQMLKGAHFLSHTIVTALVCWIVFLGFRRIQAWLSAPATIPIVASSPKGRQPRILIVTAAFGEGHNSAARNLSLALKSAGAEVEICDPCLRASPRTTRLIARGYGLITTRFPKIWMILYRLTDRTDFSRGSLPMMRRPERFLHRFIRDFKPDAIVSTYPLYPYFIDRAFRSHGNKVPVFTVVTDSIEINASWLRAPSDHWLVTDPATKRAMAKAGVAEDKIEATGFPVHPDFAELPPVGNSDGCLPFRVLFFPTSKRTLTSNSQALLDVSPSVKLTIVLGKNARKFHADALKIQLRHPDRVRLIGWTKRIPQLLSRHHLVVGKAGGATVHEAIAARCPMLIHHLVPGQEEGNLRLLESIGCGKLCDLPAELSAAVGSLLENNAAGWRAMKHSVARQHRNSGALVAADFILARCRRRTRTAPQNVRVTPLESAPILRACPTAATIHFTGSAASPGFTARPHLSDFSPPASP